jgi:hypothetical protein
LQPSIEVVSERCGCTACSTVCYCPHSEALAAVGGLPSRHPRLFLC